MSVSGGETAAGSCLEKSSATYFWLYSQILVMYVTIGFVFCYIFRGFCQDPVLEEDSWKRQEAEVEKRESAIEKRTT